MEYLSFPLLALHFGKNHQILSTHGFKINIESSDNIFKDHLIITFSEHFTIYTCSIEHRSWDNYREFILYTNSNNSTKFTYRLSPINNDPIRVKQRYDNIWGIDHSVLPDDLRLFGEEILRMINDLHSKIRNDKLSLDMLELSINY